jgi:hypothetical protein
MREIKSTSRFQRDYRRQNWSAQQEAGCLLMKLVDLARPARRYRARISITTFRSHLPQARITTVSNMRLGSHSKLGL